MLVWLAKGGPYLVVDNQGFLECLVRVEDAGGHASCPSQCNDQGPNDLVEALVHINAGCSDVGSSGLL